MLGITPTTVRWLKGNNVRIDNNVFKLHYRATAPMLILFFVVIGSRKYFGDPIGTLAQLPSSSTAPASIATPSTAPSKTLTANVKIIITIASKAYSLLNSHSLVNGGEGQLTRGQLTWNRSYIDCTTVKETERLVDNYCWFNLYIIVPKDGSNNYEGDYHPHRPVIDASIKSLDDFKKPEVRYKPRFLYAYQWIEFILFIQAVFFYLPRYLWRYCWEGGKARALSSRFTLISLKALDEEDREKFKTVAKYFKRERSGNTEYASKFITCEVLNFVNVLAQFLVLNNIFGYTSYESLINDFFYSESHRNSEHPINLIYPTMARCEVPSPRGASVALNQEYCALPVNVFIKKVYIFLWFYFFGLTIISGLALLYRSLTIAFPPFRRIILIRSGVLEKNDSLKAMSYMTYGDWFLLTRLADNMDSMSFEALIREYIKEMEGGSPTPPPPYSKSSLTSENTLFNRASLHEELSQLKEMDMTKSFSTTEL